MGREEGGGFRMGNTCMPVVDSFLYMAEPINIVKFKNKLKLKKKKNLEQGVWSLWGGQLCMVFICVCVTLH